MDRRQNEKKILFPQCFIHCQYCNFDAIYLQRKKKTISAFIFHFKQLQYLQAVSNNKHSDTHTLTDTREYIYSF